MILTNKPLSVAEIGGKAYNLLSLGIKNTPGLYVCPVSYFIKAAKDENLKNLLAKEIDKLFSDGKLYAVRSSAVDEDSAADSFAGVHESYLNVKKADILQYIYRVYESAFTERAKAYRETRGLSVCGVQIAVIIQEMVNAEFAGVINTVNPVTDNPDEIVISVARGLGDKIVDGTVSGTIYRINCGKTECEGENILSKEILNKIVALAREISAKTNTFQDAEFAYAHGKAYFLQTRAITTYQNIDTRKRGLLIDNANIAESFFGVTSPLTFSFAKEVYKDVYTGLLNCGKVRKKLSGALSGVLAEMLYYYEGKIYYNMNSWYTAVSVLPFKKSAEYFEYMIGVDNKTEFGLKVKPNAFDYIKYAVVFALKVKNIDKLAQDFENDFEKTVMPYYGKKLSGTNSRLIEISQNIQKIISGFVVPVINDCAVMYYFGKLKEKAARLGVSEEEINKCVCSGGNVLSADSANKLVETVEAVKRDKNVYNDFLTLDKYELCKKYRAGTPVSPVLQEYLQLFGARVMDELKLETVTMIENETILYAMIKDNLSAENKKCGYYKTEVPAKLKKLAAKTRKYMRLRERLRLKRTYAYSVARNIFLAFGENYAACGRINCARDIFYLTKQEIISGEGDFIKLVDERKAAEKEYLKKPVYDRVVFFGDRPLPVKNDVRREGLCGIPSGGGVVTARVRLMQSTADKLPVGSIILTKRTDPGWISLFPLAAGLIVEHGSMLSHSFVVARELGLPAVAGLKNATQLIPDGALVTLDGLSGEVKILEE